MRKLSTRGLPSCPLLLPSARNTLSLIMDTQQATAECTTAPLRPFDLLPNELLLDILAHVVDAVGRIHLSTADTMTNRACHFARFQVRQMLRLVSRRWRDTVGLEETAAYLTWRNREALLAPRPGRLPVAVQLKQLHASPWTTLKDPRRTWQNIGEVVERVPALEELLLDVDGLVEAWRAVESQSHIGNNLRKLKKLSTRSDLPYRMLQP